MADEPAIVYSVKELISRLDGKLDAMMNLMTNKADRADVTALEKRQDATDVEVSGLKTREQQRSLDQDNRTIGKRWVIGIWIAIITSMLGSTIAIIGMLTHK